MNNKEIFEYINKFKQTNLIGQEPTKILLTEDEQNEIFKKIIDSFPAIKCEVKNKTLILFQPEKFNCCPVDIFIKIEVFKNTLLLGGSEIKYKLVQNHYPGESNYLTNIYSFLLLSKYTFKFEELKTIEEYINLQSEYIRKINKKLLTKTFDMPKVEFEWYDNLRDNFLKENKVEFFYRKIVASDNKITRCEFHYVTEEDYQSL
jgi:hypothetical protein